MPIVAVGGLGIVIAALMALLIVYGIAQFGRAVAGLIPNWHIPGLGNIREWVKNAIDSALTDISIWLNAAMRPVANWILAPVHALANITIKIINLGHTILNTFGAFRSWIARLYAASLAYAARVATSVLHQAEHLYNLAVTYAARVATSVLHQAQHLYALSVAYAARVATSVLHEAQHLYNLSIAFTVKEIALLRNWAAAYANAAAAGAVGALVTDVTTAVHGEWIAITDEVKALEGVIATDLPDIGALVRAIPRAVPIDIAAAITGTMAIDRVLLRYLEKCGIPNCKNLGGFGNLLKDLINVAEGAALLGLLAQAVRDPEGTAAELDSVIGGTVRGAAHVLTAAVGG